MFIDPLYHYNQHSRQFWARKIKNNSKGNKKGQMKAKSKMAGKKFHLGYTLKTKTRKKNKFRSSTVMVLQMFIFWNQKCSLFEKNVLFSGINHDLCLKK
jgi:hypothetical protein